MLMEKCPNCGAEQSVRRNTQEFGTGREWSFLYCTKSKCHWNAEEPSGSRSALDSDEPTVLAGSTMVREASRRYRANLTLEEAMKMIAGVPDGRGLTYGSALHDVGRIVAFARRVLDGHAPHDVVETLG